MSILKSTKSGKSAVALTLDYLINHHWCKRCPSDTATIDDMRIWKNKKDFLYITYTPEGSISSFSLRYSTEKFVYTMTVRTLTDLEIVEQFWRKMHIDKGNAVKFLKQNVPDLQEEANTFWSASYTNEINRKIVSRMDYRSEAIDRSWKPQKNYFASYFK